MHFIKYELVRYTSFMRIYICTQRLCVYIYTWSKVCPITPPSLSLSLSHARSLSNTRTLTLSLVFSTMEYLQNLLRHNVGATVMRLQESSDIPIFVWSSTLLCVQAQILHRYCSQYRWLDEQGGYEMVWCVSTDARHFTSSLIKRFSQQALRNIQRYFTATLQHRSFSVMLVEIGTRLWPRQPI